jgi:hypothetical protein
VQVWEVDLSEALAGRVSERAHGMNVQRLEYLQHQRKTRIVNVNAIESVNTSEIGTSRNRADEHYGWLLTMPSKTTH